MRINAYSKEEALEIAKKKLNLSDNNFEIRVIREPEHKLLGIVKKEGIYEVTISDKKSDKEVEKSEERPHAWVENGQLRVNNPQGDNSLPLVYVNDDNFSLVVNGKLIRKNTNLKEDDDIVVTFHDVEPISKMTLSLSDDKMEATLNLTKVNGKSFYLKDKKKTTRLNLETGYKLIPPKEITLDECIEILHNAGVKDEFIDMERIHELLSEEKSSSKVVARGKPMVQSEDAVVVYAECLSQRIENNGVEPTVEPGEVLAVKESPAKKGSEGITVAGEIVYPDEPKDVELLVGEGALLSEDKTKITSQISGRPYLKKGIVSVLPVMYVNGDLNKDTGNIDFEGDVVVRGSVMDEMVIKATGKVTISGSVYNSEIFANNSVEIQGKAISSKIEAGTNNSKLYLINTHLTEINDNIMNLFKKLRSKDINTNQKRLNAVKSYSDLIYEKISEIGDITSLLDCDEVDKVNKLIKILKNSLLQVNLLKEEGFKSLFAYYNEAIEFIQDTEKYFDDQVNITTSYAENCLFNSCGNILIKGKGSYQTDLIAQNEIIYSSPTSVIKGGTLIAGKKIKAGTVGTPREITTVCRVIDKDGVVTGKYYPGTQIYINNVKQEISTIS